VSPQSPSDSGGQPDASSHEPGIDHDTAVVVEAGTVADPLASGRELNRGVAVSAGAQMSAKGLHFVLNIVSTLAIIHYLDPGAYGQYVLVLTSTMLVGLLADFGLTKLATREVARDFDSESQVLGTVLAARIVLAFVALGVVQLLLLVLGATADAHAAAAIASLMYVGEAVLVVVVVFHVRVLQQYEAFIRVGMETFETALVLVLISKGATLPMLFVAPALATGIGAVVALIVVRRRFGVRLEIDRSRVGYLMKEALPIGPSLFIAVCYLKLDALVLASFRPSREIGLYGSAYQPIEYAFLATAVVINVAFPLVSQSWGVDHERFVRLYRRGCEVLLGAMLLAPVLSMIVGPQVVTAIYGPDYAEAAEPLRILSFALVLMTLNGWQALVLLAAGRQKVALAYNLAALAVAAVAAVSLVSWLGMRGAALASLTTAVFVLCCSTVAVGRLLHARLELSSLARLLAAAGALSLTLVGLDHLGVPWLALIALTFVIYPVWLLAFGVVKPSVLRQLRHPEGAVVDLAHAEVEAEAQAELAEAAGAEPNVLDLTELEPGVFT
jgi:O-antigen/teichoic acid export membrane protein